MLNPDYFKGIDLYCQGPHKDGKPLLCSKDPKLECPECGDIIVEPQVINNIESWRQTSTAPAYPMSAMKVM